MSKPYSTTAQVTNRVLATLMTQAGWVVTEVTGDVAARIAEADNEIDSRLAAMGYTLPFTTNPPALQDLSVLFARYACFRDLYVGNNPQANPPAQAYKDRFEEKLMHLEEGWAQLVDTASAVVPNTKFQTQVAAYPESDNVTRDNYPNYPNGPYPDPPGVDCP